MTSQIQFYQLRRRGSNLKSIIIKWTERGMMAAGLLLFWYLVCQFVALYLRFHG